MFKPEKIHRAIVIVPKDKITKVIRKLEDEELCQIKEAESDELGKTDLVEQQHEALNLYSKLVFVKESLEHHMKQKKRSLLKEIFSKRKKEEAHIPHKSFSELARESEKFIEHIEKNVREKVNDIKKIQHEINKNNFIISNLKHLPNVPTSYLKDTEDLKKIIGLVDKKTLDSIPDNIKDDVVFMLHNIDKDLSLLLAIFSEESRKDTEAFVHSIGFEEIKVPFENSPPSMIINRLKSDNVDLIRQKFKIKKELNKLYLHFRHQLDVCHEELVSMKERIDALLKVRTSESFSVMECWVPEKNLKNFSYLLHEEAIAYHMIYHERGDAPTLLKNPKLIKPFETITELYSLPKYGDFDPTPIIAITFSFFFAFMLTDFVYGLILLVFGLLLVKGKGRSNEKIKDVGIILSFFGLFTCVLGALFGSYFGDLFQQLGFNVVSAIDALDQVMIVLVISLIMGAVHITAGLFIGLFENFRKKKVMDGLLSQSVWILFLFSIVGFILHYNTIGFVLLGLSVSLQFILTFMQSGSISAVLSLFNFPGFIGDLFSYGRLMALAMGTTGIALAVNFMSIMAWDIPYIGPVLSVVIFISGHIFNMAMNGLGAFVHSVRLHFLEFFSRFYEGSGKKYVAFGQNTITFNTNVDEV